MPVTKWDPFQELATMHERLNRMFGELQGRRGDDDMLTRGDWIPPVDIHHNDRQELVLEVDLPGMQRGDIDLRVEDATLTIRGERRRSEEIKDEQYHRVERSYGSFVRSFSLPNTVDTGKVRAEYKDGVLSVVLPTREEAKPKQIQVKVS